MKSLLCQKNQLLIIIFVVSVCFGFAGVAHSVEGVSSGNENERIVELIERLRLKAKIPGLAVVVFDEHELVFEATFGSRNLRMGEKVERDTLFELGSNSKAFTALGILLLEQRGLVHIDAPVRDYIPWLKFETASSVDTVRLRHLLNHSSGIPFESIAKIPALSGEDALKRTVEQLQGTVLDFQPGEKFSYATFNYDVLGLVIESVTGQAYEDFMLNEVLQPLGLERMHVLRQSAEDSGNMALGYKYGYFGVSSYDAPIYRGNTPAGYLISSVQDLKRWVGIQLGLHSIPDNLSKAIDRSRDLTFRMSVSGRNLFYAGGWFVNEGDTTESFHDGANPNYSSYIKYDPELGTAVGVLANINSEVTYEIAEGIARMLAGGGFKGSVEAGLFQQIAMYCDWGSIIAAVVALLCSWRLLVRMRKKAHGRLEFVGLDRLGCMLLTISVTSFFVLLVLLYQLPMLAFYGFSWSFLYVWAPSNLVPTLCLTCLSYLVLAVFLLDKKFYRNVLGPQ